MKNSITKIYAFDDIERIRILTRNMIYEKYPDIFKQFSTPQSLENGLTDETEFFLSVFLYAIGYTELQNNIFTIALDYRDSRDEMHKHIYKEYEKAYDHILKFSEEELNALIAVRKI